VKPMNKTVVIAILLLCTALGCTAENASTSGNLQEPIQPTFNNTEKPVVIRVMGSFGEDVLSVEELAKESDVVVIGRVREILPARWDTADGRQPAELSGHKIYTDVVVEVEEYLKNPQPEKMITVRTEGGRAGNVEMITGDASFTRGERVVLFLWKSPSGVYVVKGGAFGKFSVVNNTAIRSEKADGTEIPLDMFESLIEH